MINLNKFSKVLVVSTLAIFIAGCKSITNTSSIDNKTQESIEEPYKTIFNDVSKIFIQNLDSKLNNSHSSKGTLYWPINNGALATITNSFVLDMKSNCDDSTTDGKKAFDNYKTYTKNMDNTIKALDNYLISNNFQKVSNKAFSTKPFSEQGLGSILGYKNDELNVICTLIEMNSCGKINDDELMNYRGYFTCNTVNNFNTQVANQQSYLETFGSPAETMDITGQYGNFYNFNMGSPIGPGAYIIARKNGVKWEKIYEGQDYINCDLAKKYNIPHQLNGAEECYDSISKKTIENPY